MLYAAHEAQRLLLRPFVSAARLSQRAVDAAAPLGVWPFPELTSASLALFDRVARRYDKPAFGIDAVPIDGREVAVRERISVRRPFADLVAFERALPPGTARGSRVLVVAPLSGHHATLLRETVRTLLPDHDVWITDWRDARLVPRREGAFSLDTYVEYVVDFLRHLGPETHVVAVCQPSVPVLAAV
jgi:poly(3-hydroxybutyrate) depolymerase